MPARSGEEMGEHEPLTPRPEPGRQQEPPLPEEETYERGRGERPDEGAPLVEDE